MADNMQMVVQQRHRDWAARANHTSDDSLAEDFARFEASLRPKPESADSGDAMERVFAEEVVAQATRLGIHPTHPETPGHWRDRVRKAAIVAALSRPTLNVAGEGVVTDAMRRAGGLAINPDEDVLSVTGEEAAQAYQAMRAVALATQPQADSAAMREALERLVHDVDDLIGNSEGVYGLHQNGDPSPWEEIAEGGRFEPWLGEALAQARQALATTPSEPIAEAVAGERA